MKVANEDAVVRIGRMDRIINEHYRKIDSLKASHDVLNLKNEIEKYNKYKETFLHPKKGVSQVVSNDSLRESIKVLQNDISKNILLCFYQ